MFSEVITKVPKKEEAVTKSPDLVSEPFQCLIKSQLRIMGTVAKSILNVGRNTGLCSWSRLCVLPWLGYMLGNKDNTSAPWMISRGHRGCPVNSEQEDVSW